MKLKKSTNFFRFVLLACFGLLLAGCAKYKAEPLYKLSCLPSDNSNQKEFISLTSKQFTKKDCKQFLGRNVLAKGYQPIQITIVNNSNNFFEFSREGFSLPLVPVIDVANKVHISTVGRSLKYGFLGLVITPVVLFSLGFSVLGVFILLPNVSYAPMLSALTVIYFPAMLTLPVAPVVSVVSGVVGGRKSSKVNSRLDKDYMMKELNSQTINPFSVINGLLFVPKDKFNSNFTITLTDKINNKNYQLSALSPKIEF